MRDFHPCTTKKIGDRVKVPKHPASEECGYYYGTVVHIGPSDDLRVQWDQKIPFMARTSNIEPAILV
jgi:hypothetical protein